MKKGIKIIIYFVGIIVILAAVFYLSLFYVTNCKKIDCDVSVSPNQNHELTLQQIGEPDWPFGSVSGRLVLVGNNRKIVQADFELRNDGASISDTCWKVTWYEDYVEVILSGEEQGDEKILLYFDGQIER